jgi:hypothetical protein
MFDSFDHERLLAYIEGELDADDAARLERELEYEPQVRAAIGRMRRDRELLSGEREPTMPRDFLRGSPAGHRLAEIESRLARPMLMETLTELEAEETAAEVDGDAAYATASPTRPGAYRRQHQRMVWHQRLVRFSVAAGVTMTIGGGVWIALAATDTVDRAGEWISAILPQSDGEQRAISGHDADARRSDRDAVTASGGRDWPSGAIVHHAPGPLDPTLRQGIITHLDVSDREQSLPASDRITTLGTMLVLRTNDAAAGEAMLARLAGNLDESVALVRNFSHEEASRLAAEYALWLAAQPEKPATDHVASVGGMPRPLEEPFARMARDAREQLRQTRGRQQADELEQRGRLAGAAGLTAPLSRQIDFSSRGATHTVTIPARKLHELLQSFSRDPRMESLLVTLPPATSISDGERLKLTTPEGARDAWLTQRRQLQQLIAQLDELGEETVIHLAVRIEPDSARR